LEVYFDNSATTAVRPEVVTLMCNMMTDFYGNPSSLHRMGFLAQQAMEKARGQIAAALRCRNDEIIFTSGGTEANNLGLLGAAQAYKRRGNKIVTTQIEHPSVIETVKRLGTMGFETVFVPPLANGTVSPEAIAAACDENTILLSVMHVNSETGAVNDLAAISRAARRRSPSLIFHSDCVQSFCRLDVFPQLLGVDLVSVSGHKLQASKGAGALYVSKGLRLIPPLCGSGQERGLRPGTENVPAICGMGLAVELMYPHRKENIALFRSLYKKITENLSQNKDISINSAPGGAPYILNISVAGIRSEIMIHYLENEGIYVSSGSACSKGARSHVLSAMGLPDRRIDSAVRISFSSSNTLPQADKFCEYLLKGSRELQKIRQR